MPFPNALTAGELTTIRGGGNFERYLAVHTPSIMLQFNPNANASGKNLGQITYTSALSGSDTNVLLGMTVVVTPTSDYAADLINDIENCLVTYVRAAATSTTLDIGMTNFQWTTGDFVTVLDDFRVHEKPILISGTTIKKDYDITYRKPLPRIYDLYSDVVIATGSTYDYSPTPSAECMDASGSISSWSWQVIENGTLTHTSSSATPTFTLDVGTSWLHVTVTDVFGNSNWMAVLIVVVPSGFSSVVHQSLIGDVTTDLNSGISASLEAYGDVSSWVPGSAAVVFTYARFADASNSTIVEMVGWLGDVDDTVSGSEQFGIEKRFSCQIVGVAGALEAIRILGFPITETAASSEWGDLTRVTIYDSIWYALSEHTTVPNVAAIDLPTNYTDYRFGTSDVPSGSGVSSVEQLAFRAEGGAINWSPHGEIVLRKSLLYERTSATRDAATVYTTYTTADGAVVGARIPPPNVFAFNRIIMGCATYNSTTKKPTVFSSKAPGGFAPGALLEEIDGIILAKNLTFAQAYVAAGQLASNHFFAATNSTNIDLTLAGGYVELVPSVFQWHKLSAATTDFLYGQSFDTNTRFLCLSKSVSYDPDNGGISVNITLREETDGGNNYAPETEWISTQSQQNLPPYPIASFYPGIADADLSPDTYGDDFDDQNAGWQDESLPAETAAEETGGLSTNEVINVSFRGGSVSSSAALTSGASYLLRISGEAQISESWRHESDFTQGQDGWQEDGQFYGSGTHATYVAGSGWEDTDTERRPSSGNYSRGAGIYREFTVGDAVITKVGVIYDLTKGDYNTPASDGTAIIALDMQTWPTTVTPLVTIYAQDAVDGDGQQFFWNGTNTNGVINIQAISSSQSTADYSGDARITKAIIEGTGTNPFNSGQVGGKKGDAFYQDYQDGAAATAYATGKGLQIDSADPSPRPAYNSSHIYEYTVTGDGTTISFEYVDPDADATDNEGKYIRIEIIAL